MALHRHPKKNKQKNLSVAALSPRTVSICQEGAVYRDHYPVCLLSLSLCLSSCLSHLLSPPYCQLSLCCFLSCRYNSLPLFPPRSQSGSSLADLKLHNSSINLWVPSGSQGTSLALRHTLSDISDQYGCHIQSFSTFTEPSGVAFLPFSPVRAGECKNDNHNLSWLR